MTDVNAMLNSPNEDILLLAERWPELLEVTHIMCQSRHCQS